MPTWDSWDVIPTYMSRKEIASPIPMTPRRSMYANSGCVLTRFSWNMVGFLLCGQHHL